jgi:hypothetical protein
VKRLEQLRLDREDRVEARQRALRDVPDGTAADGLPVLLAGVAHVVPGDRQPPPGHREAIPPEGAGEAPAQHRLARARLAHDAERRPRLERERRRIDDAELAGLARDPDLEVVDVEVRRSRIDDDLESVLGRFLVGGDDGRLEVRHSAGP